MNKSNGNSSSSSSSNPFTNRSIIPDNDNVEPPPLFNKHLQPSSAPPSASEYQLKLFQRVRTRRSKQLRSFSLPVLQSLYQNLTVSAVQDTDSTASAISAESTSKSSSAAASTSTSSSNKSEIPITSSEITNLIRRLPSKKPSDKNQHISLIEYILIGNFHSSCDSRLQSKDRTYCLKKVRYILHVIDKAFQLLKEKGKEWDKLLNKSKAKPTGNNNSNSNHNKNKMGSLLSSQSSSAATESTAPAQAPKNNEIIILDDTPPSSPTRKTASSNGNNANRANNAMHTSKLALAANLANALSTSASASTSTSTSKSSSSTSLQTSNITKSSQMTSSSTSSTKSIQSKQKQVFQPLLSSNIPPSQNYIPSIHQRMRPFIDSPVYSTPTHQNQIHTPLQFQNDSVSSLKNMHNAHSTSYSLVSRSRCKLTINTCFASSQHTINAMKKQPIPPPINHNVYSSIYLDGKNLDDFERRLHKWDPYWKVISNCSLVNHPNKANLDVGYKTTTIIDSRLDVPIEKPKELPKTACNIPIELDSLFKENVYNKVAWGTSKQSVSSSTSYQNGEKRLILRMLPLILNPKYKKIRSDTHLWPKGTFLEFNSRIVFPLYQRKQQQHDSTLWKGLSHALDLTEYMKFETISHYQRNKIPMNISFCTKDTEMYGVQIAVCEYVSPDSLFDTCMSRGGKGSIAKMSYEDGLRHAMKHFEKETLCIDSDDENDNNGGIQSNSTSNQNGNGIPNLTCSLICPVSMQVIKTPVRGKNCNHLNCFDLRTYLQSNSNVSGGRWRCFVCEDFISLDDLIYDGFIAQVLETFGKNVDTSTNDKMQLSNDGSWKLLSEASASMKRNQKKRMAKESSGPAAKKSKKEVSTEVITLDD